MFIRKAKWYDKKLLVYTAGYLSSIYSKLTSSILHTSQTLCLMGLMDETSPSLPQRTDFKMLKLRCFTDYILLALLIVYITSNFTKTKIIFDILKRLSLQYVCPEVNLVKVLFISELLYERKILKRNT